MSIARAAAKPKRTSGGSGKTGKAAARAAQRSTRASLKASRTAKKSSAAARRGSGKKPSGKKLSGKKIQGKGARAASARSKRSPAAQRKAATTRQSQKPIQVHYWPTPNGWKVTIMLEECGLPYEIVPVNIGKGEQFAPEFLKIAPNNRMPAIVDPAGPGGRALSIFESGAILRYLGEKSGRFYPADLAGKARVDQWLFWQMAGLGPMAGQCHHFRLYAPPGNDYGIERYTNEVNRLYGVMETQLRRSKFLAGATYSIADMAAWPWAILWKNQGQDIDLFPALKAWLERVGARPAVKRGFAVGQELRKELNPASSEEARKILFGQRARVA